MQREHGTLVTPRMKTISLIVAALFAGFVGGILGTISVLRYHRPAEIQVIRAHRFELLNDAGERVSYWGRDKGNQLLLVFENKTFKGDSGSKIAPAAEDFVRQRIALGVSGDGGPLFEIRGADGRPRLRLLLNEFDKPTMIMDDESGVRAAFGYEQPDTSDPHADDWALQFLPNRARMGMYVDYDHGKKYLRGFVKIRDDKLPWPPASQPR